jgi:hypothetical protein
MLPARSSGWQSLLIWKRRWLARKRGLEIKKHKTRVRITGPKTDVEFSELAEPVAAPSPARQEQVKALATLAILNLAPRSNGRS